MKLVWFRNDLRTGDHHALYQACADSVGEGVLAVAAITPLQWQQQDESRSRVQFWLANLRQLQADLTMLNIPLKIIRAATNRELPELLLAFAQQHQVNALYFNHEYPAYEQQRDEAVCQRLQANGIACQGFHSDLVLPPGRVLNQQGQPYKVFTPFSKTWRQRVALDYSGPLPAPPAQVISSHKSDPIPAQVSTFEFGAHWCEQRWPTGADAAHQLLRAFVRERVSAYPQARDFPAQSATSSLSPYLSVGVLSTRQCLAAMQAYSESEDWFDNQWVTELIWREFYRHLLVQFPEMNRWQPFKPEVEARIHWLQNDPDFQAWSRGETGFPIVDAGMKQLLETGWMHNRVRMIVASFLTKLLRQDWRVGARFFMQHLIDGDFASNLGGWQWSASVGADAAPYFRIFNPLRQADRFDHEGDYVAQWLPELEPLSGMQRHDALFASGYGRPQPIIDYARARQQSIDDYNRT